MSYITLVLDQSPTLADYAAALTTLLTTNVAPDAADERRLPWRFQLPQSSWYAALDLLTERRPT